MVNKATCDAKKYCASDEVSPKASFHLFSHARRSGYSISLKANKYSDKNAMATIHVARMKKGQILELMSVERRGNTTAPNLSTAIRTRL